MIHLAGPKYSLFFFIGFLSVFGSFVSAAQDIQHISGADTIKSVNEIQPIPQGSIGTETEATLNKIREIEDAIQPTIQELLIDSLSDQKMGEFNKIKARIDLDKIPGMNPLEIENLQNNLIPMRQLFSGWRDTYMDNTNEINILQKELADTKTAWEKTLNLKSDSELPAILVNRIKMNLGQINDLETELTKRNNALLTKEDKLTVVLIYIDDVLSAIGKTTDSFRSKIFSINSPPIWQLLRRSDSNIKEEIKLIFDSHVNDLRNFTDSYKTEIYYHILFFIFLVFISYYIKNEVAKWSDEKKDDTVSSSLYIISRPISSSLIITLSVTGIFYPQAPSDVISYFYVLLIIPLLLVVPGLIYNIERKYFFIVGGILIFSQITRYLEELTVLDRFNILILDGATIALLAAIVKNQDKIHATNPTIRWAFPFTVIKLCLFLLSVAVVSNIVGGAVLSKVLTRGSLNMVLGGAILYSCYIILKSLFALFLQYGRVSRLNIIQYYSDDVKRTAFRIFKWAIIYYWLYLSLSGFVIYHPIYDWINGILSNEWQVGSIVISLGSILAFFLTLWVSLLFSKFVRFLLQDEILTHFELPRGVPGAISMLVRLVLIGLGFILAFGAAKIDMDKITIVFGALGVGIGFGLQNIFNNLVSGLILAFERPIQVGDVIEITGSNLMGEVKDIGIRASIIRTFSGAEVIVPNGNLISNEMINWTLSDHHRRQEIIVGVAYRSDLQRVLEILNEIVLKDENVLKKPEPSIIFIGFGDSSLNFEVRFWTNLENGLRTKSEIGIAINNALNSAGIEIPFPQRDLNLRTVSDKINFSGLMTANTKLSPKEEQGAKKENNGNTGKEIGE